MHEEMGKFNSARQWSWFIDDQWNIQQRVGALKLLAKSMSGEEVAQQIVSVVSQELGIPSSYVIVELGEL